MNIAWEITRWAVWATVGTAVLIGVVAIASTLLSRSKTSPPHQTVPKNQRRYGWVVVLLFLVVGLVVVKSCSSRMTPEPTQGLATSPAPAPTPVPTSVSVSLDASGDWKTIKVLCRDGDVKVANVMPRTARVEIRRPDGKRRFIGGSKKDDDINDAFIRFDSVWETWGVRATDTPSSEPVVLTVIWGK